jgi:hypothetical protein
MIEEVRLGDKREVRRKSEGRGPKAERR